jgi:hypothetical protein
LFTEDIVKKIEERRKLKHDSSEEERRQYRTLRNEINRDARKAKERYLEERCKEVEELTKEGKLERAYKTIKQFFGTQRIRCNGVQTEEGVVVYEQKDIAIRWKQYLEKLYGGGPDGDDTLEQEDEVDPEERGDCILRDEFDQAVRQLKDRKAPGIDDLPAELIKAAGDQVQRELFYLVCRIYETG